MEKYMEELMKEREPVHPKCLGEGFSEEERIFLKAAQCERVQEPDVEVEESTEDLPCFCSTYAKPSVWWNHPTRRCPLGNHFRPGLQVVTTKTRAGQQKQKKRR